VGDVTSGIGLGIFWPRLSDPGTQLQAGSVSLKFLLEPRLKSKYFKPLIGFLMMLVQKLQPEKQNLNEGRKKDFNLIFEKL